jgi:acylphosphatase
MTAKVARRLVIHGRVQGVGFRYSMYAQALRLGITGWVRNRVNGTVEATVAGAPDAVEQIVAWSKHGPRGALVTDMQIESVKGSFDSFEQLPTA